MGNLRFWLLLILVIGGPASAWMSVSVLVANSDGTWNGVLTAGGMALAIEFAKVAFPTVAFIALREGKHGLGMAMIAATIPMLLISLSGTMWNTQNGLAAVEVEAAQTADVRNLLIKQAEVLGNSATTKAALATQAAEAAETAQKRLSEVQARLSKLTADNEYFSFIGGRCVPKRDGNGRPFTSRADKACEEITPLWNEQQQLLSQTRGITAHDGSADVAAMNEVVAKVQSIDSGTAGAFSAQGKALESIAKMFSTTPEAVKGFISWSAAIGLEVALMLAAISLLMYTKETVAAYQQQTVPARQPDPVVAEGKGIVQRFAYSLGEGFGDVAARQVPVRFAPPMPAQKAGNRQAANPEVSEPCYRARALEILAPAWSANKDISQNKCRELLRDGKISMNTMALNKLIKSVLDELRSGENV